jgi:hypothetical protein
MPRRRLKPISTYVLTERLLVVMEAIEKMSVHCFHMKKVRHKRHVKKQNNSKNHQGPQQFKETVVFDPLSVHTTSSMAIA